MPEPDTAPQPRTPSPSSVDWKAAEEETKRQFAAKAAGRKILTYEEWDKERRDKNEKWRQERKRKEWVEREVARRALQEERGDTREAVLRSATSSASRPLTDKEWEQMQEMAKHLPAASERPKKDGQQLGDKEAKKEKPVVRKEAKHSMPPPDLPAPLSPGYTGVWRGGCCPGFRFRGHPGGGVQYAQGHQRGPQGHQYGPQGFQYVPQGPQGGPQGGQPGFQGHHPGLQGQQGAPVSLGLGPVRYRSPQEIAEATAWLERHSGGPALDLRPPETVVMHEVAMARAKAQAVPPECQQQQREEPPARPQEGETLLQRILRLAREGSVCIAPTPAATPDQTPDQTPEVTPRAALPQPSSRTLSSTSEPEVVDVQLQYDESSRVQNESMALRPKAKARPNESWALRPKARPAVQHDPQHGAMAAGSGGDGGRRDDEDSMRRRGTNGPAPDSDHDDDDEVEETESQEFMYRMKRRSDELTGRKNKFLVGKNSSWEPQKLRRGRGHI